MSFLDYFKEKFIFITINIIVLIISSFILLGLGVDIYAVIFVGVLNFLASIGFYIYDYFVRSKYYNDVLDKLEKLDKKYFISDVAREGDFLESKILYEIIEQSNKSMKDDVSEAIRNSADYKEYIEMWVHEIKTPISSSKLVIENNKNEQTLSILEEIEKIENFIEQVLYYSKSNELEKDYIIRKTSLRKCINNVIKRNKKIIRENKISIEIDDFESFIYCDSKWLEFILNQIIINSIKYIGNYKTNRKLEKIGGKIKIYIKKNINNIELYIDDNGVGIDEKDLHKVFEKGFTGTNGRKFKKSTGMGLYISKKLCSKMYLGIDINSKINEYTTVKITFPQNNMTEI